MKKVLSLLAIQVIASLAAPAGVKRGDPDNLSIYATKDADVLSVGPERRDDSDYLTVLPDNDSILVERGVNSDSWIIEPPPPDSDPDSLGVDVTSKKNKRQEADVSDLVVDDVVGSKTKRQVADVSDLVVDDVVGSKKNKRQVADVSDLIVDDVVGSKGRRQVADVSDLVVDDVVTSRQIRARKLFNPYADDTAKADRHTVLGE